MKDYFDETKYILEAIFFRYKDASYRGHGIMTWQPDAGFHIEASVRRNGGAQPKKITFGGNAIETIPNILLRPQGYDRAIAFPFVPINPLDLFINKHLSAQCGRVLFFQHSQPFSQRKILRGSALYHLIKKPIFPDSLTTETCLAGHKIKSRVAREAIWYEDPKGLNLSGHMITDNEFQLNWAISDNQWTKKDCWNWAKGVIDARIISPSEVETAGWVRLKCQFGCGCFGQCLVCPPFTPTPQQMREVLDDYRRAVLIHCEPEADVKAIVAKLERDIFLSGYWKVFGLGAGPCYFCKSCPVDEQECRYPDRARPSMEACGINVFSTVKKVGFPIEVVRTTRQCPNYYGLILVD